MIQQRYSRNGVKENIKNMRGRRYRRGRDILLLQSSGRAEDIACAIKAAGTV